LIFFITFAAHFKKNKLLINRFMNYLNAEQKKEIFEKYGQSNTDTGSAESQIALFSYRINHLTEHLKQNKKDHNTERSLLRLVGKRRKMLNYLKSVDIIRYRNIIKALNLRK
jgi:small subunit ribosomal protein S15